MDSQKARMEFALANASAVPNESALSGAVGYVSEQSGIQLSTDELSNILSLYPVQRGKLAAYGWGDTEVRELILDVVANFIANTRWPVGKDDVDIHAFIERLKAAARFMGSHNQCEVLRIQCMKQANCNQDETRSEYMKEEFRWAMVVGVAAITLVALRILWIPKGESLDTQTLSLDSSGCVATTPGGQPLEKALAEGLKAIPKGTTFTAQCFGL